MTNDLLSPSRRLFLASAGAFVAWANLPKHAFAGTRDPRFVVMILRGALDGLAAVPPVGDPDYAPLRGELAIGASGFETALPLDGFFGLNDSMPNLHRYYQAGEALIVHAAASPYRERSHFDGQDVLESGMPGPRLGDSGWLNRVCEALPTGEQVAPTRALAVAPTVPLILRGEAPTLTWTPPDLKLASFDTAERLLDLYAGSDPVLADVFAEGLDLDRLAEAGGVGSGKGAPLQRAAAGAARFLSEEAGPRIALLNYDGWDTHVREGVEDGRLARLLSQFDASLGTLADGLASVWSDTVIAIVTEFGRTARANGNDGTDHGTATVAVLLGGAVAGGRVIADWPGLKPEALYEARDLAPTIDLRAVLKGVLRDHLGLSERVLAARIFPDSIGVRPLDGLIA
jgi:uncharacterized protein (DUF1501 family)